MNEKNSNCLLNFKNVIATAECYYYSLLQVRGVRSCAIIVCPVYNMLQLYILDCSSC